ncbi:thiamine pyrophosphate-dependent enzyme [Megasphaera paucivorans]|uniref:Pyruvate ferredoxin oxidoreductase, beta subunit n=1 Tax=Megasphaera paucivorans TaxID=349095 RepID=A0A1G9WVY8_9FIRM|nr:thiamine pyrophosphate-dependent enzyme [Megasphaera paucivorans]SDM88764.1 pyruvate ferredoxin oxidoreductase, beta subunit [Megasphaera paucivorans]
MINVKEIPDQELLYGHKACPGCGAAISSRLVMKIIGQRTFLAYPASCISTVTSIYPQMNFNVPSMTAPFAATGAVLSGMRAGVNAKGIKNITILGIAGDGGTADIGIQSLSGVVERGDDIVYICYDNEAYMNTGVQRSSSTPYGATTTTTPAGKKSGAIGEQKFKKNLFDIMVAHRISYCATASIAYPLDFMNKVQKAKDVKGPAFIQVMAPCPTGWGFPSNQTVEIGKLAVQTGLWYLAEYENEKVTINIVPKIFKPIEDYLMKQRRFKHLKEKDLAVIREWRDHEWQFIKKRYLNM